jgi:hypothetical protein
VLIPLPPDVSSEQEMVVQLRAQVDNLEQENQNCDSSLSLHNKRRLVKSVKATEVTRVLGRASSLMKWQR